MKEVASKMIKTAKNTSRSIDNAPEDKVITPRQLGSITASTLLGVGILTMSRNIAEAVDEAAWIVTLLGGLIAMFFFYIIIRLSFRFPLKTIATYAPEILGRSKGPNWLGKLLSFPLVIGLTAFWILTVAITLRSFGEVVVSSVLPNTPLEVIIITMLFLAFFLTCFEIEVVARVNELILPLIGLPLIAITFFSVQKFKLEFILPLWPHFSLKDFFAGILLGSFAYIGYEILMVYGGYTVVTRHTHFYNLLAFAFPVFIYTTIVLISIGSFGVEELKQILWPTLELIKIIEIPGVIFERVESAFLAIWMAAVFTTSANIYYAACFLTKKIVASGPTYIYGLVYAPLVYWIALQPQNVFSLFEWAKLTGYVSFVFSGLLPLLLYVLARLRGIGLPPSAQYDQYDTNKER